MVESTKCGRGIMNKVGGISLPDTILRVRD